MSVREDRLRAEWNTMRRFRSQVVSWKALDGSSPPETYLITYNLKSLVGFNVAGQPIFHIGFSVEVRFPIDYPRTKPEVRLTTKPWPLHPNIWADGRFCLEGGQRWIPGIGVSLDSLCQMMGEIIAFQHVNLNSPANRDSTLTSWIRNNLHFESAIKVANPLDSTAIRLPDVEDAIRWGDEQPISKPRIRFS